MSRFSLSLDVDKGTKTINGTIKIAPVSIHLDVCLVNVPNSFSDPAFAPSPEAIDQRYGVSFVSQSRTAS